jgi:hypothetical protein
MNTRSWPDDNRRYLSASLAWLRLRLQAITPAGAAGTGTGPVVAASSTASVPAPAPAPATVIVAPSPAPVARSWFGQKTPAAAGASGAPSATPALPPAPPVAIELPPPRAGEAESAIERAAAEREAAAQVERPPALVLLQQRFRLSDFDRDTLLLAAAAEFDPGFGALFAAAQGHPSRTSPTFALALLAFDQPTWEAMSPHHALRQARLVEVSPTSGAPLTASPLHVDERIVNYLKGLNALDERLSMLVTEPADDAADALSPTQAEVADAVLARLRAAPPDGAVPIVQLLGTDRASQQAVARHVCAAIDRRLYTLSLDALPTPRAEIDVLARLWQRESVLLPVALYVDAEALDPAHAETASALQAFLSREPGLVFVGLREALAVNAPRHVAEVRKPSVAEQGRAWRDAFADALPDAAVADAARRLAGQFDLNLPDIHEAAARALGSAPSGGLVDAAWDASRELARPRLDALAQRLEPVATWDDLVLPPEATALLHQVVDQVRGRFRVYEDWGYARKVTRGRGISAFFAGESGTGKTMAAEVVANALRLNLYRIDLSAVVSKYIGETEKNLRRLFDAAEQGGAILFFDEADALFGKRSEIKDSHDRFANIEINYLLQRMEAFGGLAILATNMKSALDAAFLRRLRFIVNFPFPGPAQRREMWEKAFPGDVPRDALDLERLARFHLSGGNIHSIALNAAFAAAQREGAVTQPLLLSAVRTELRKLDKPVNEAEFR